MDALRRQLFIEWFNETFKGPDARAKFMKASAERGDKAISKGRVTQLFNPKERFGEDAAKALAERFGLPEDRFLRRPPDPNAGWPFTEIDRAAYERLTPEARGFVQARMMAAIVEKTTGESPRLVSAPAQRVAHKIDTLPEDVRDAAAALTLRYVDGLNLKALRESAKTAAKTKAKQPQDR